MVAYDLQNWTKSLLCVACAAMLSVYAFCRSEWDWQFRGSGRVRTWV